MRLVAQGNGAFSWYLVEDDAGRICATGSRGLCEAVINGTVPEWIEARKQAEIVVTNAVTNRVTVTKRAGRKAR